MATYRYRARRTDGAMVSGAIDAIDQPDAIARIRGTGAAPVELRLAPPAAAKLPERASPRARAVTRTLIGELAVLLGAGLPLDRALALAIANIEDAAAAAAMAGLLRAVREGASLSQAMREHPALFTPTEAAMAEAGEASGRLGEAMGRLAVMLEQAAELRRLVSTALIYPVALLLIAVAVIGLMLLYVVPQFERLLDTTRATLPAASLAVIGASRLLRENGLALLAVLAAGAFAARAALARPSARAWRDATLLRLPLLGELIRRIETARFAHTLSALLDGGVPLASALMLAQRTIGNTVMAGAIARVATGLREGGGLAGPLAAAQVLPRLAIGFLRTGEETSELGLMLGRLATVLDRDVKVRLERLVAILTPAITVVLGTVVAGIIASIMSAILGFNDLATAP